MPAAISETFHLQVKYEVDIFASSRFSVEIEERFESCVRLEIRAKEEDMRSFLNNEMSPQRAFLKKNQKLEEIKAKIVDHVEVMYFLFRYPKIH